MSWLTSLQSYTKQARNTVKNAVETGFDLSVQEQFDFRQENQKQAITERDAASVRSMKSFWNATLKLDEVLSKLSQYVDEQGNMSWTTLASPTLVYEFYTLIQELRQFDTSIFGEIANISTKALDNGKETFATLETAMQPVIANISLPQDPTALSVENKIEVAESNVVVLPSDLTLAKINLLIENLTQYVAKSHAHFRNEFIIDPQNGYYKHSEDDNVNIKNHKALLNATRSVQQIYFLIQESRQNGFLTALKNVPMILRHLKKLKENIKILQSNNSETVEKFREDICHILAEITVMIDDHEETIGLKRGLIFNQIATIIYNLHESIRTDGKKEIILAKDVFGNYREEKRQERITTVQKKIAEKNQKLTSLTIAAGILSNHTTSVLSDIEITKLHQIDLALEHITIDPALKTRVRGHIAYLSQVKPNNSWTTVAVNAVQRVLNNLPTALHANDLVVINSALEKEIKTTEIEIATMQTHFRCIDNRNYTPKKVEVMTTKPVALVDFSEKTEANVQLTPGLLQRILNLLRASANWILNKILKGSSAIYHLLFGEKEKAEAKLIVKEEKSKQTSKSSYARTTEKGVAAAVTTISSDQTVTSVTVEEDEPLNESMLSSMIIVRDEIKTTSSEDEPLNEAMLSSMVIVENEMEQAVSENPNESTSVNILNDASNNSLNESTFVSVPGNEKIDDFVIVPNSPINHINSEGEGELTESDSLTIGA